MTLAEAIHEAERRYFEQLFIDHDGRLIDMCQAAGVSYNTLRARLALYEIRAPRRYHGPNAKMSKRPKSTP